MSARNITWASYYERLAIEIETMTDEDLLTAARERGEDPEETRIKLQTRLRKAAGFKEH